jgi:DNA topoisomerase IB
MARLRRVDCSGPGIRRRRRGRGFEYLDADGQRVEEDEVLDRIRELVIPPAWEEVWICPYPMGHIQATGTDQAGRKQYLYHQRWRDRRDQEKFESMERFARSLPALRERVAQDLVSGDELSRERVLACAVRLLDRGFFRIGSEDYAEQNQTFGLATMRKRHVRIEDGLMTFDYRTKNAKRRVLTLRDDEALAVIAKLKRRRSGEELLAYKEGRRWRDLGSEDINAYLKEITGGDFSAKDFRTWSGTVLAAVALAVSGAARRSESARKRAVTRAVKEVAHYLGNTPAVSRASYIDPRVIDRFREGLTIGGVLSELGEGANLGEPAVQGRVEQAVLDLIDEHESSPVLERLPEAA